MTIVPKEFRAPRRVDGVAVKMAAREDGSRVGILAWAGNGWEPASGVDMAEFLMATPASHNFLDKLGIPPDDPSRAD